MRPCATDGTSRIARRSCRPWAKRSSSTTGLLGVCLSGAGPSILALAADHEEKIGAALSAMYDRLGLAHTVRTLRAHQPEA